VRLNEHIALYEHTAGAKAKVIDAPLVRGEHLHQDAHSVGRRVDLPTLLAFGTGELLEEVFIDVPNRRRRSLARLLSEGCKLSGKSAFIALVWRH
jgi:hypothetical protein